MVNSSGGNNDLNIGREYVFNASHSLLAYYREWDPVVLIFVSPLTYQTPIANGRRTMTSLCRILEDGQRHC